MDLRRRLLSPATLFAVLLSFLLAGCGGQVIHVGDTTVLVAQRTKSGHAARSATEGVLSVVGGCLGINDFVVVWPHGTTVSQDSPLTIDIPSYGTFRVGMPVQVGGGFVLEHGSATATAGDLRIAGVTVPAACARSDVWVATSDTQP